MPKTEEFKKIVEARKKAYTGDLIKQWLGSAYVLGIEDFGGELKKRFEEEAPKDELAKAGLLRAIGIIMEYGS